MSDDTTSDKPASAPGAEEVIYSGKPQCAGAPGQWCRNTKWLITTAYIEREHGICCNSIDNIQLIRVKDLQYNQTCCCGCCGDIIVFSSDKSTPELHIKGVPNGKEVYGRVRDAVTALHGNAKLEMDM